jgi:hypothetical protein
MARRPDDQGLCEHGLEVCPPCDAEQEARELEMVYEITKADYMWGRLWLRRVTPFGLGREFRVSNVVLWEGGEGHEEPLVGDRVTLVPGKAREGRPNLGTIIGRPTEVYRVA